MELEKFVAEFADQFDDTDASEIKAETKFHDLEEWSSLIAMGVIALAKIKYGKPLSGSEIRSCNTVEDLFHLLQEK